MKCLKCESDQTQVIDSRPRKHHVTRRRECLECGSRFTTFEVTIEDGLGSKNPKAVMSAIAAMNTILGLHAAKSQAGQQAKIKQNF